MFFNIFQFCLKAFDQSFPSMGLYHGVAMDFLEFHPDLPCPTLLLPAGRPPLKGCFRDGPPAAIFYPFGHHTLYAYAHRPILLWLYLICLFFLGIKSKFEEIYDNFFHICSCLSK
jgi:hypothetical protein